jgi:dopamine receptor D1
MNGSHQGEKAVLAENGEILQHPINADIVSVILKFLSCSIGIPLNLFIAFTIIQRRRLHRKPRNFFLMAIILSYLSFFIPPAIELIYWGLYPVESVCHAYVAVVTVPQGLLLTNMLLALTDRYLAINHPLLHRKKMTTRLAGCLIITCSLLTLFLMKFVYIVQLGTLHCEVWLVHVKMILVISIILFTSCVLFNMTIYRQTKTLLRESRTLEVRQDERVRSSDNVSANILSRILSHVDDPRRNHADKERLRKMEMEATQTLMIEVASLCVMPCLALTFIASYFGSCLMFGQCASSHFLIIVPLIKEMSLTPAIYGPVIFLVRNKELRAPWACHRIVRSHDNSID